MDWPSEGDLKRRLEVMLGLIRFRGSEPVSILDLGCGVGLLVDYLKAQNMLHLFEYWGIDLSEEMVATARRRHPTQRFEAADILQKGLPEKCTDYVIMNGLLTEKVTLKQKEMEMFARSMVKVAFDACRYGVAFNVMSTHVDWTRSDLFHWPLDRAAAFLVKRCSRWLVIRMDYGLYEYTVYVHREPNV
jgi:SAM-dependent methyltransferase